MRAKRQRTPASIALTARAIADIREVESYSVAQWGRKVAERYVDELASALDRLGRDPGLLRRETDFSPHLFFYRVQKHVLACDYREGQIVVLTVIHTSMNLPERLAELQPGLAAEAEFLHSKLRLQAGNR